MYDQVFDFLLLFATSFWLSFIGSSLAVYSAMSLRARWVQRKAALDERESKDAFGLDANRILEEFMHVKSRDPAVADRITELFRTIDEENFVSARHKIDALAESLGANDSELLRARSLISFLEGEE
jgi:hypothetical protein